MNYLNATNARRRISFLKGQGSMLLGLSLLVSNLVFSSIAQAAIIGVDLEAGNGSPTNWNSYSFTDGTGINNLIDETGASTDVDFQLSGVNTSYVGGTIDSNYIPSHTNDLSSVCCDILYGSTQGLTATATWSGLESGATYNYWVFASALFVQTIEVTGNTVVSFTSPETQISNQAINDILGSNASLASFALQIQASDTGTIQIEMSGTSNPGASGFALELAPVPIPGAAWLFGSGLIGLIGIARKKEAA